MLLIIIVAKAHCSIHSDHMCRANQSHLVRVKIAINNDYHDNTHAFEPLI